MIPFKFTESNIRYKAPQDLEESQVRTINAYHGVIIKDSLDGLPIIVTAWKPDERELEVLKSGGCVYMTLVTAALPPHLLTTSFQEAINPS